MGDRAESPEVFEYSWVRIICRASIDKYIAFLRRKAIRKFVTGSQKAHFGPLFSVCRWLAGEGVCSSRRCMAMHKLLLVILNNNRCSSFEQLWLV